MSFNALTPLGSARQTGLGDVSQLSVTGDTTGTVTTTTQGKPGIGQGACTNSGDGHIRYDQLAQRWLFTTPSFTRVGGLYAMCHAVSVGTDPTGPFNRYVFRRSLFPDYPRVAVWPDAYYNATSTGDTVIEKHACAVDRLRMLQGLDATEQCIIVPAVSFMEPADLDGQGLPPAGAPEHFFAAGGYQLREHLRGRRALRVQVPRRLRGPDESTFTGPSEDHRVAVSLPLQRPAHAAACRSRGARRGSTPRATRSCTAPSTATTAESSRSRCCTRSRRRPAQGAERWYELRLDGGRDPYLYQQSTYAPDNHYRWLGSPNIDRKGDIALAFSYGGGPYILPIATTLPPHRPSARRTSRCGLERRT